MKTRYKYSKVPFRSNIIGNYIVYPENTDLNDLLLRWSLGEPMGSEMKVGNYLTGIPVRPTSDLTDIDKSKRLVAHLQKQHDDVNDELTKLEQQAQIDPSQSSSSD